jgi:hypothetical protein
MEGGFEERHVVLSCIYCMISVARYAAEGSLGHSALWGERRRSGPNRVKQWPTEVLSRGVFQRPLIGYHGQDTCGDVCTVCSVP